MRTEESVFDETYRQYLQQVNNLSLGPIAGRLGAKFEKNRMRIPLLNNEYALSGEGIFGPSGERPAFDICVILSKYALLCPDTPPARHDWVSFRDFKDSAPLTNYFSKDVEGAIGSYFSGKLNGLKKAGDALGGVAPDLDVAYDLALQFDALPKIPLIMLYNDSDEDFAATCSVLFESRADKFLDPECLAMLGGQLFRHLRRAFKTGK